MYYDEEERMINTFVTQRDIRKWWKIYFNILRINFDRK